MLRLQAPPVVRGVPIDLHAHADYARTGLFPWLARTMKLTVYTDYTLRVLMYLAARPEAMATIPEIAQQFDGLYGNGPCRNIGLIHAHTLMVIRPDGD